ncbi:MAG: polysaccharide biosynthesis protein, partial [Clostridia bacterium]|nr:polysaccharide biosynthesis protein [Clostridia bacterium]
MSILNQSRRFVLATADFFVVFLSSIFVKILIQFLILGLDADYSALIVDSLPLIAAFSGLSLLGMIICRNYHVIWRFATMRDLIRCIGGVSFGAAITAIGIRIFSPTANKIGISWNNIYFLTITFLISSLILCVGRILYIIYFQARSANSTQKDDNSKKVMIIGAGYSCKVLLNEIQEDKSIDPVCIVDDDPNKISRSFRGVRIYGPIMLVPDLCEKFKIDEIIFAIPSCPDERRKEILNICSRTGCEVRVLPKLSDIAMDNKMLHQVTSIDTKQLLERGSVDLVDDTVTNFINGKICMVTGGGGSIGSELCRQIVAAHPKQLIILDIYENTAYELQQEILLNTDFRDMVVEIASVRDYSRMDA